MRRGPDAHYYLGQHRTPEPNRVNLKIERIFSNRAEDKTRA